MKFPFTTQPLAGMLAKSGSIRPLVSAEEMEEIYIDALAAMREQVLKIVFSSGKKV